MSDSSWQLAVLREMGVSQRGLQTLGAAASSRVQAAWGAEAPPRPTPQQEPAAPVAMPAPQSAQVAAHAPTTPSNPTLEPPPPAPMPQPVPAQAQASEPLPPPPAPPAMPSPAREDAELPPPPPAPTFLQQPAEQQEASPQEPAPDAAAPEPQQPEPGAPQSDPVPPPAPVAEPEPEPAPQPDFDWAAAVNPLIGVDTSESPAAEQPQPEQPEPADAHASAPVGPPAAGPAALPAEELVRKNQHGDPLGRRLGQGVRRAVGGGSRDAREMAAFAELMQRQVPSTRQIAVASVRGGAGKTTMAALVATELARHRPDRVLAADADAELGSLPLRLGIRAQLSLFDLAAQNPRSFEEAARFLTRTPEGLFVLSSTRGGRIAGEFTLETFQGALSQVARYVGATVIDCGAGILTELNRGVVAASHGLILVTPGTVDGALSARGALEYYAANDQSGLLRRTVIAMVSHAPQVGADLQRAHQMLAAWGLPVVFVPYDRHLATGSSLDMSKISTAARTSVTRIVHEVFARSLTAPGPR